MTFTIGIEKASLRGTNRVSIQLMIGGVRNRAFSATAESYVPIERGREEGEEKSEKGRKR